MLKISLFFRTKYYIILNTNNIVIFHSGSSRRVTNQFKGGPFLECFSISFITYILYLIEEGAVELFVKEFKDSRLLHLQCLSGY